MSIIKETAIVRPPQGETVLYIPGLVVSNPDANRYYTDTITPPSGTLTVDGDVIVDGAVTCDPLYVDNVHVRTAGHHINVHNPLDSNNMIMGGNTATLLDLDDTMAADSATRIPSQRAVKAYIDSRFAGGAYFAPPLYNDTTVVSMKNNALDIITAVSTDGTLAADSDTLTPTQKAVVTYMGNYTTATIRTSGTMTLTNGLNTQVVNFRLSKTGREVCLTFLNPLSCAIGDSTSAVTANAAVAVDYLPTADGGSTFDSLNYYMYTEYTGIVVDQHYDIFSIVTITGGLAGGVTPTLYLTIKRNASGNAFVTGTTAITGSKPCITYLHY